MKLTQKYIKSLFNYRDGILYWKISKQKINIGDKAGGLNSRGYYSVRINNKLYLSHRLIYLYHYGYIPKELDHIDNNRQNNNIGNLREVTRSQNNMNAKKRGNVTSKYKGVSWDKSRNKWRSYIFINNKQIYLGRFTSEKTAAFIYNVYARGYFNEYAKLNNLGNHYE